MPQKMMQQQNWFSEFYGHARQYSRKILQFFCTCLPIKQEICQMCTACFNQLQVKGTCRAMTTHFPTVVLSSSEDLQPFTWFLLGEETVVSGLLRCCHPMICMRFKVWSKDLVMCYTCFAVSFYANVWSVELCMMLMKLCIVDCAVMS